MDHTESYAVIPSRTDEGTKMCGKNVDAVPFTPRSCVPSVPSALSPDAPEFYPRNYTALFQENNILKDPVMEVRKMVANLVERPGDFDQVMAPLVESLTTGVKDDASLDRVIDELFTQAVKETNFHYSGARVCCHLCQHLKLTFASFHNRLASRCQDEYRGRMLDSASLEDASSLIGFTIFMGELLVSTKDNGSCLLTTELPEQIAQLLHALVLTNTNDSLHCALQVLKLTGAVLEDHGVNLDPIFAELERSSLSSESTRLMISGLLEQRANNWGRRDDEIAAATGAGDTKNYVCLDAEIQATDDPVYFDYQNAAYSREEVDEFEGYTSWPAADGNNTNPGDSMQYWIGDHVMDASTATAFEEFVAECGPPPLTTYWSCRP